MRRKLLDRNPDNFLKAMNMYKVVFTLAAIAFSFAASAAQSPVHFESGSARVEGVQLAKYKYKYKYKHNHKKRVWVGAHRSHGHWVKGHYIWR